LKIGNNGKAGLAAPRGENKTLFIANAPRAARVARADAKNTGSAQAGAAAALALDHLVALLQEALALAVFALLLLLDVGTLLARHDALPTMMRCDTNRMVRRVRRVIALTAPAFRFISIVCT
jgi:hypothetical protein